MSTSSQRYRSSCKRGFTLIELLVVLAIMVVISAVVLVKQSQFDSSTLLRSLGYSVALSIQQAQVYGVSVLGTTTASTNCVNGSFSSSGTCYASAYGVYFNEGTPSAYTIFADLNPGHYDAATVGSETVKTFSLGAGYTISEFCGLSLVAGSIINDCYGPDTTPGTGTNLNSLAVLFQRPNPDATFVAYDTNNNKIATHTYTGAYVQVESAGGGTRSVEIVSNGQIVVQPPSTSVNTIVSLPSGGSCTPNWSCAAWGSCVGGTQTCSSYTDSNNCGQSYTGSPMTQTCTPAPTCNVSTANPTSITLGSGQQYSAISWSSTNALTCSITGQGLNGSGTSGTQNTSIYTTAGSYSYSLSCTGTSGSCGPFSGATVTVSAAQAPAVTSVSPGSGTASGGTSMAITGTGFTGATAVNFGGTAAAYVVNSATSITATSPAGNGTVDVTVTTSAGTSATSQNDQFTYNVVNPTVTAINPTSGVNSASASITSVTGTGFVSGATVSLTMSGQSTISCSGFTFNNATTLSGGTCPITSAAAGAWNVVVTNPGQPGPSGQLTGGFTITAGVTHGQIVLTSGTSWQIPAGVTTINVWAIGGGGGGGAASGIKSGGGAGGIAFVSASVTQSSTFTYSIGTGGTAGTSGGATSVTIGGITTLQGNGGGGGSSGGTGGGGGNGGTGGTASGGTTNVSGGNGGATDSSPYGAGGGGTGGVAGSGASLSAGATGAQSQDVGNGTCPGSGPCLFATLTANGTSYTAPGTGSASSSGTAATGFGCGGGGGGNSLAIHGGAGYLGGGGGGVDNGPGNSGGNGGTGAVVISW